MKNVKLTYNKFALVDNQDFELLNQWKWYAHKDGNTYYAVRGIRKKDKVFRIFMHRVILGLKYKDGKITDHSNRDGLDNRRENLRVISVAKNAQNHRKYSQNTSGYNGVYWSIPNKKWKAQIMVNKRGIYLGYYDDINDAIKARKQGEIDYWEKDEEED